MAYARRATFENSLVSVACDARAARHRGRAVLRAATPSDLRTRNYTYRLPSCCPCFRDCSVILKHDRLLPYQHAGVPGGLLYSSVTWRIIGHQDRDSLVGVIRRCLLTSYLGRNPSTIPDSRRGHVSDCLFPPRLYQRHASLPGIYAPERQPLTPATLLSTLTPPHASVWRERGDLHLLAFTTDIERITLYA